VCDFYKTDNAIENDLKVFYGKEQLAKEQKLFFKILLPCRKKNIKEKFYYTLIKNKLK
jgi:hypothetical protein